MNLFWIVRNFVELLTSLSNDPQIYFLSLVVLIRFACPSPPKINRFILWSIGTQWGGRERKRENEAGSITTANNHKSVIINHESWLLWASMNNWITVMEVPWFVSGGFSLYRFFLKCLKSSRSIKRLEFSTVKVQNDLRPGPVTNHRSNTS